jgi:hypothetical protein
MLADAYVWTGAVEREPHVHTSVANESSFAGSIVRLGQRAAEG